MKALCTLPLLLLACETRSPQFEEEELDAPLLGDRSSRDGDMFTLLSDRLPLNEAAVEPQEDQMMPDLPPFDGSIPEAGVGDQNSLEDLSLDFPPLSEEICDGLDNDGDGQIDEELSNPCGGCGPVPPEGCLAWELDLMQDSQGLLDPDRLLKLLGRMEEIETLSIPNGECLLLKIPAVDPELHLGILELRSPQLHLRLLPTVDPQSGNLRYLQNPHLGPSHLHEPGDLIHVSLPSLSLELEQRAPGALEEVEGLEALAEAAREPQGFVRLAWQPSEGALRLYIGGSRPLFNSPDYRAIEHYQLQALLEDDGELLLAPAFFGGGLSESAVWVYLARQNIQRHLMGASVLEMVSGSVLEHRLRGELEVDEPSPLRFLQPSPEVPHRGEEGSLTVRWSPLPEDAELSLSLTLHEREGGRSRQLNCEILNVNQGLEIPREFLEPWPSGEDDLRQITLNWTRHSAALEAPDQGRFAQVLSLILRLEP